MMNRAKTKKDVLVVLLFIVMSFAVIQIGGYSIFLWVQILFCISMAFFTKKIPIQRSWIVNAIFFLLFCSGVVSQFSNLPETYKKTAVVMPVLLLPTYFSGTFLQNMIKKDIKVLSYIKRGIKIGLIINLIWIPIQIGFYYLFRIDLNSLLFTNMLHLTEKASFIRAWIWYPSGLTYHSALLAPLFVIGYLLFDNLYLRAVIIIESMLIGNSTAMIGVIICIVGVMIIKRKNKGKKIYKRTIIAAGIGMIVLIFAVIKFDLIGIFLNSMSNLYLRIFGANRDESTAAHFRYYADYLIFLKRESLASILFGYGYGCSGYLITTLYDRYRTLGNWAIETDIVDILVSRGILGFIMQYLMIFRIMFKGRKIDPYYSLLMLTFFIQGFGYAIQFDYVMLFEIILLICVERKINLFASVEDNRFERTDFKRVHCNLQS